jgi:hypothetical protein
MVVFYFFVLVIQISSAKSTKNIWKQKTNPIELRILCIVLCFLNIFISATVGVWITEEIISLFGGNNG